MWYWLMRRGCYYYDSPSINDNGCPLLMVMHGRNGRNDGNAPYHKHSADWNDSFSSNKIELIDQTETGREIENADAVVKFLFGMQYEMQLMRLCRYYNEYAQSVCFCNEIRNACYQYRIYVRSTVTPGKYYYAFFIDWFFLYLFL